MKRRNIVIAIPHAGTAIPEDIRRIIPHDDVLLYRESDLYTDRIYSIGGVRIVCAEHSQIIADVNRAPDEAYLEGANRAQGVIKLSLSEGENTFSADPSLQIMDQWIKRFHRPFHEQLTKELRSKETQFLIDCHSMWSSAARFHPDPGEKRAEIVLGNREYSSCSAETTQFFRHFFEGHGFSVAINDPFPGRYILGTYANRFRTPGIQIEINKKLYMNEETFEPFDEKIKAFNALFAECVDAFCGWYEEHGTDRHMVDLSE